MGETSESFDTVFTADHVPGAPVDTLYSLVVSFESDRSEHKVDLGVGAYRDDNARPWVLPVIKKAQRLVLNDPRSNHEYLPIAGIPEFNDAAQKLILGEGSPAIRDGRVCTFQTISGTGAVHLGGLFLARFLPRPTPEVYISSPTWPVHRQCFAIVDLKTKDYTYFSTETKSIDFEGMKRDLLGVPNRSIILFHACAHNPTGADPSEDQWKELAQIVRTRSFFPFFDSAYQGFASGSVQRDSFPIRHFVDQGIELIIAQSFAKNMGLYGQRVGAFHYVAPPGENARDTVARVSSQLAILQRSEISSPPIFGAQLASLVLNDRQLFLEWEEDLRTMSNRIIRMRKALRQELEFLGTPGSWEHITRQIGMFSFTGLNEAQVLELRVKWHVYMLGNGRISVAGLNSANVKYFARAIDDVVRRVSS